MTLERGGGWWWYRKRECALWARASVLDSQTFPSNDISIDNRAPELPQHGRHGAFPRGDTSRQPHQEHPGATQRGEMNVQDVFEEWY